MTRSTRMQHLHERRLSERIAALENEARAKGWNIPELVAPVSPTPRGEYLGFSLGSHWWIDATDEERVSDLNYIAGMGVRWVRVRLFAGTKANTIMSEVNRLGLKMMGMFVMSPSTPTATMESRLDGLMSLGCHAIQIWNEPNTSAAWSPISYEGFMAKENQAIQYLVDQGYTGDIVPAGMAAYGDDHTYSGSSKANGYDWIRAFYDVTGVDLGDLKAPPDATTGDPTDLHASADGWAWHAYTATVAPSASTPDNGTPTSQGDGRHGGRLWEELYEELEDTHGITEPAWITEAGYTLDDVSAANQATFNEELCRRYTSLEIETLSGYTITRTVDELRPVFVYCFRRAKDTEGSYTRRFAIGPDQIGGDTTGDVMLNQTALDNIATVAAEAIA